MLYNLLVSFDFETIDKNNDGVIDLAELQTAALALDYSADVSRLLIQNLLNIGDVRHTHGISKADILAIGMTIHDEIRFADTHKQDPYSYDEFRSVASSILGSKSYDEAVVRELFLKMDENGDGFVSHGDLSRLLILKSELDTLVI